MKTAEEILEEFIKEDEHNCKNVYFIYPEYAVKAMKTYANQKLEEAANNLDWENCFYGGCHCSIDRHEQSILSLKDEV